MEYKNVQSGKRDRLKDFPDETNIDYENDNDETLNDEKLKRLGRQVED